MSPVPVSLPFADRSEAGRRLAERLRPFMIEDPLVLALPRGGVPVGAELARHLDADLDVLVVHRLGLPEQPEVGVGAIAENGRVLYDDRALARMRLPRRALEGNVAAERAELDRMRRAYRGDRPLPRITGRDCVVVDDGSATGGTARAALRMLRQEEPAKLVLAVPVASHEAVELLREEADALVVLGVPDNFREVGEWYRDFGGVSDDRVREILAEHGGDRVRPARSRAVRVPSGELVLDGDLTVVQSPRGAVVTASGEGRGDPRRRAAAAALQRSGYTTLVLDLCAEGEHTEKADAALLGGRLADAIAWLRDSEGVGGAPVGVVGDGAAAPAALVAAALRPGDVAAVVAHGGRVDLADTHLRDVRAPALVLLESRDSFFRELGEWARARMGAPSDLRVVSGAEQLFRGAEWRPAAVEALDWFDRHLGPKG